jgi:hypothetical protein
MRIEDGTRVASRIMLDELDRVAQESLNHVRPEDVLINFYGEMWLELKQRACTSAGFTGVSEYLFFRAIVFMLEDMTGEKFLPDQISKDAFLLKSPTFILTKDLNLKTVNSQLPNARTDIAVFQRGPSDPQLLGAFEHKLYVSGPDVLNELFQRLGDLAERTESLIFPVLCNKQYVPEVDSFCASHDGRAFAIGRKGSFARQVTLRQAVQSIVKELS